MTFLQLWWLLCLSGAMQVYPDGCAPKVGLLLDVQLSGLFFYEIALLYMVAYGAFCYTKLSCNAKHRKEFIKQTLCLKQFIGGELMGVVLFVGLVEKPISTFDAQCLGIALHVAVAHA